MKKKNTERPRLVDEEAVYLKKIFGAGPAGRQRLLNYGSGRQINAVSEFVLNTLKDNVDVTPNQMAKLRRYKTTLREVGKRKNSIVKRRKILLDQKGRGFWKGLGDVCCSHLDRRECMRK